MQQNIDMFNFKERLERHWSNTATYRSSWGSATCSQDTIGPIKRTLRQSSRANNIFNANDCP